MKGRGRLWPETPRPGHGGICTAAGDADEAKFKLLIWGGANTTVDLEDLGERQFARLTTLAASSSSEAS